MKPMPECFVLDNSIVMSWCFEDESNALADAVLESFQQSKALVPAIWPLEVGNVLLVAERGGRLSEADSTRFLSMLSSLPIQSEMETPQRAMSNILFLAREHQLSTYDASYLDLAMREGVPVATLDKGLRHAAKRCRV
ncbi:MAG: type II toxin-antitoxin system VapC family toxin, partial [Mariprofundaceae bacterium]